MNHFILGDQYHLVSEAYLPCVVKSFDKLPTGQLPQIFELQVARIPRISFPGQLF